MCTVPVLVCARAPACVSTNQVCVLSFSRATSVVNGSIHASKINCRCNYPESHTTHFWLPETPFWSLSKSDTYCGSARARACVCVHTHAQKHKRKKISLCHFLMISIQRTSTKAIKSFSSARDFFFGSILHGADYFPSVFFSAPFSP